MAAVTNAGGTMTAVCTPLCRTSTAPTATLLLNGAARRCRVCVGCCSYQTAMKVKASSASFQSTHLRRP
ncbi:hypothetical protein EON66_07930 [archaeon]|nr:MAG: hypothetical protein EON66_07930 [archaeon]